MLEEAQCNFFIKIASYEAIIQNCSSVNDFW